MMRDLDDEIQVVEVEVHYDFAAAARCGSRDHRAEMKRIKIANLFFCGTQVNLQNICNV